MSRPQRNVLAKAWVAMMVVSWAMGVMSQRAVAAPADPATITYVTWRLQDKELIDQFNKENPDINVLFTQYGGDRNEKLPLAAMGETPYDVVRIDHTNLALLSQNIFLPLDQLIERDRVNLKEYLGPNVELYRAGGRQLAMPVSSNAETFAFNLDHFDAAGLAYPAAMARQGAWDRTRFHELAKKLTRDKNGDGVPEVYGFSTPPDWVYYIFLGMAGGGGISADGRLIVNAPGTLDGLSFLHRLLYVDQVYDPKAEWDTFMAHPDRVAMSSFYGWSVQFANDNKLRYDIVTWPRYKEERFIGATGDALAIMAPLDAPSIPV